MKKNRKPMIIAIIAGICLLLSGISGVVLWKVIYQFVSSNIIDHWIVQIVFAGLIFIASLGGISVIIGGILIGKNKIITGKFFIMLGTGIGLLGLLISILVTFIQGNLSMGSFFSIGVIGIVLSILARFLATK
jgi:hypothetical protein